jgi:hypothetical protein
MKLSAANNRLKPTAAAGLPEAPRLSLIVRHTELKNAFT